MNCRRVRSQLSAYVDNELTGYEMLVLRDHLSHCRECRDEHYSLKTMKYLLSALPEKEPNPEWVALLAESFSRPSPTLSQKLLIYWERSLNAAVSFFVSRNGQEGALVQNRRLASALVLSAVGVFLVTATFDRPMVRTAPDPNTSNQINATRAGMAGPFSVLSSFHQPPERPASIPDGAIQFIKIPLPPSGLSGNAANFLPPSALMRPQHQDTRNSYLTSINMHVIPPPGGMNGFGAPLTGMGSSFGH